MALVSVLLPILFLGGLTGELFVEFGVTLAGAVIISSFIALTLTPMLSTRVLQGRRGHSRFYEWSAPFFERLSLGYRESLVALLRRRWVAFPLILASAALIVLFLEILPAELAPLEDRESLGLNARAAEGATFEYMDAFVDDMIALLRDEAGDEIRLLVTVTSPGFGASTSTNSAFARIYLTEPEERQRSQHEIANALRVRVGELTGARILVSETPTIAVGRRRGLPVQFVVQAANLEKLQGILPTFVAEAERHPVFSAVDVDLVFDKPELRVTIDRDRAQDLGISALDIAETIQLTLSEQRLGFFVMDGKQYEVIGQVERANRDETLDLTNLYVPSGDGTPVLLDKVVTVSEESRPPQLYRYDRVCLGHGLRRPEPGTHHRRRDRGDAGDRGAGPGRHVLDRPHRAVARLRRELTKPDLRVPPGPGPRLPDAGRAVRELPGPVHHHALGPAGPRRGPASPSGTSSSPSTSSARSG